MMKASLDVDGCLLIEAENGVEAYALNRWVQGFPLMPPYAEGASTIMVDTSMEPDKEVD